MKTLFNKIRKENTNLSDIICFIKLLHTQKYKRGEIRKGFENLVNKKDYEMSDKESLLEQMYQI